MGCAIGSKAQEVRDAREEVAQLRREKNELERRLLELENAPAKRGITADPPSSAVVAIEMPAAVQLAEKHREDKAVATEEENSSATVLPGCVDDADEARQKHTPAEEEFVPCVDASAAPKPDPSLPDLEAAPPAGAGGDGGHIPVVAEESSAITTVPDTTVPDASAILQPQEPSADYLAKADSQEILPTFDAGCITKESTQVDLEGGLGDTTALELLQRESPQLELPSEAQVLEEKAANVPHQESDASTTIPASNPVSVCTQCSCELHPEQLFRDGSDMNWYCEQCWISFYGEAPIRERPWLVPVEFGERWSDYDLQRAWRDCIPPGWPPLRPHLLLPEDDGSTGWEQVSVRVHPLVVGPHAREQTGGERPRANETLKNRYVCSTVIGQGHFTKAYLAFDLELETNCCLKRHRSLTVEALADLMVLGKHMARVDPEFTHFPRLVDAFYDVVGYTVESLVEGRNCLAVAMADPTFFPNLENLKAVARGTLKALALLDQAGVVHNDVKPDNVVWMEANGDLGRWHPTVQLVDFGCARLDQRLEGGRNWSLAEGGAGHLGKWSPEMVLRLPITTKGDVWGFAVSLCELHCGRQVWRNESDTAEVVCAQALGLCNLMSGLPNSLLRRSPLDIRQLYTPAPPGHFPLKRGTSEYGLATLHALRPLRWGLEQIIGEGWRLDPARKELGDLLEGALQVDPEERLSASELLAGCPFAAAPKEARAASPEAAAAADEAAEAPAAATAQATAPETVAVASETSRE